jgi:hypothetical protein
MQMYMIARSAQGRDRRIGYLVLFRQALDIRRKDHAAPPGDEEFRKMFWCWW